VTRETNEFCEDFSKLGVYQIFPNLPTTQRNMMLGVPLGYKAVDIADTINASSSAKSFYQDYSLQQQQSNSTSLLAIAQKLPNNSSSNTTTTSSKMSSAAPQKRSNSTLPSQLSSSTYYHSSQTRPRGLWL